MLGLNKATLIGNLGAKPQITTLEGNISVAKFNLATNEKHKTEKGETIIKTEWHSIVLWRNLADIASKYLDKGSLVYIEGKIKTRNYKDNNGNTKYVTEIIADSIKMLDKPITT